MRAELKDLHSPDIELQNFFPEDPSNFGFYLEATIGQVGKEGGDIFGFRVASLQWMKKTFENNTAFFVVSTILMNEYHYGQLQKLIEDLCSRTSGENWEEVSRKIGKFGDWEFENYKPAGS